MRVIFTVAASAMLAVIAACSTPLKVTSDYDKAANFQQYKTFAIYPGEQKDAVSQLNVDRIHNAIRAEMTKKGFQENTTSPDLLVNSVAILKDRQSVTANTNYYGYGGYYRPYMYGGMGMGGTTTYDVQNYKDGSLIIDIVSAADKKLLWQGIGNKEIDKPIKDPDTKIPQAIAMIMADFPPGMKTKK